MITGSSIHSAHGICMYAEGSSNIVVHNNVIAKCIKYGIGAFERTNYLTFTENLFIGIRRNPLRIGALYDMTSAIDLYIGYSNRQLNISHNLA